MKRIKNIILIILVLLIVGCKKNNPLYTKKDDNIYFGYYPKSLVSNNELIKKLNRKINGTPTLENNNGWESYNYYLNDEKNNYMFYKDIDFGNSKYRGIYLLKYRPKNISYDSNIYDSYQDDNGYDLNNIYWFKYEKIKWDILKENNDEITLITSEIIDSQNYANTNIDELYLDEENTKYANNYELSFVRCWINNDFYNLAFSDLEKSIILEKEIDNSGVSFKMDNSSNNTFDKVTLLSYDEAYSYYSSSSDHYYCTGENKTVGTDYAFSQGLYLSTTSYSNYRLRTPSADKGNCSYYVDYDGAVHGEGITSFCYVGDTSFGIRPVITIKIDNK